MLIFLNLAWSNNFSHYFMIFLDCLIFYLTIWFEEHKEKLSWSTPIEREIYVVGIVTILWLFVLEEIICFFILKTTLTIAPLILVIILDLAIMQGYSYIYIKKNRNELINSSKRFTFNKNTGKILSIIFVLLSFIVPYLMFMIFT